ncbi:DUF4424 family protein [uncultured Cohaesibacter sp.]|uniref:DUF4424 family protein n=1 Tax=uncultured Cohaesibacter sp. TaxID=1002546 RepID=UPI0029C7B34C|nr:DUF4424 family protein [uncultured Cohaesibacter sp.]
MSVFSWPLPRSLWGAMLVLLSGWLIAVPVEAQQTYNNAGLAAHGIHIDGAKDLTLQRQELYLSTQEIRLHYEFRNEASRDLQLRVSFPIDGIESRPAAIYIRGDDRPVEDPANFLDLAVSANGQAVVPEPRFLAIWDKDITDELSAYNIPLNRFDPDYASKMADLPADVIEALREKGLVDDDYSSRASSWMSEWYLEVDYAWVQVFPAGAVTTLDLVWHPMIHQNYLGKADLTSGSGPFDLEPYCLDSSVVDAFEQHGPETLMESDYSTSRRLDFQWSREGGWSAPVGSFQLVIDRLNPEILFSTCQQGLKQVSPTRYELQATDYRPEESLQMLFIELANPASSN